MGIELLSGVMDMSISMVGGFLGAIEVGNWLASGLFVGNFASLKTVVSSRWWTVDFKKVDSGRVGFRGGWMSAIEGN
jgi:hypothetical protein